MLNRPYGGFPWILLPPVLYDTFPNAHNGYGDFTDLEQASLDDAAAFFDTYYAPGNARAHRRRLPRRRRRPRARAGREALRRHPGAARRPVAPVVRRAAARPASAAAVSPDAHAPLPALAVGYRLPDPVTDLDAYLGHACSARVLADGEAARLQQRLVHVDGLVTDVSASAGLMGPARRARPRHVHDHRGAPADGGPGPGARRGRRGARQARRRRPGRGGAGPPGAPAGPPRCTTSTTG